MKNYYNDLKELAAIIIVCVTVGFCVSKLSACDTKSVNVTCDIKVAECRAYLDGVK